MKTSLFSIWSAFICLAICVYLFYRPNRGHGPDTFATILIAMVAPLLIALVVALIIAVTKQSSFEPFWWTIVVGAILVILLCNGVHPA